MVKERCLKKSYKDSLEDIKERMKEKRNKKWAKLGKPNQIISTKCKIADNSSTQLKSFQANNLALALALEEEKSKMREAQDIILHLKKEYQALKFQMFALQRRQELQQEKEHSEARFLALRKIILKVVENLVDAVNLLSPASNLCSTDHIQTVCAPVLEEGNSSCLRAPEAVALLRHVLTVDVTKQDKTFRTDMENVDKNVSELVSDSSQHIQPTSSAIKLQTKIGQQIYFHEDQSKNISSNKDEQHGSFLPKSVSTRRHCFGRITQNEVSISEDHHSEISEQIKEFSKQETTNTEKDLNTSNNEDNSVCQETKSNPNKDQILEHSNWMMETNITEADPKQKHFVLCSTTCGASAAQKERGQKRKLEATKIPSKMRPKRERSQSKQASSKAVADTSVGSSDAYDFIAEESVHVTPFRQNKENENSMDNNYVDEIETCTSESCISEDDMDDSLYVPHAKNSKSGENAGCNTDVYPVYTRRLRRAVCEQQETNTEGKGRHPNQSEKTMGIYDSTEKSSAFVMGKKTGSNSAITSHSLLTGVEKVKEHNRNSENFNFERDESCALPKSRLRLGDITNRPSSLPTETMVSHCSVTSHIENTRRSHRRTVNMNYKEPSISGKLRRGDPFTDTGFLNSPIFKEKKGKRESIKKKSLSRYNEAFVGCL